MVRLLPSRSLVTAALLASAAALASASAFADQASLQPIEAPGVTESFGNDVTNDGVVVGSAKFGTDFHPFRWSGPGTIEDLGSLSQTAPYGMANAVSADGETICGVSYMNIAITNRGFRWRDGTFDPVPTWGGGFSDGYNVGTGISADGSVVVGYGVGNAFDRGFRYEGGVRTFLENGAEPIYDGTSAHGISGDGTTIVGDSEFGSNNLNACRWNAEGEIERLTTLPISRALAASYDGSVIVGYYYFLQPFVYTDATGARRLPTPMADADHSKALDVSDDGTIVAGFTDSAELPNGEACLWVAGDCCYLRDYLAQLGVDLEGWSAFQNAKISPDGLRFTGQAVYQGKKVAFLVTVLPDFAPPTIESAVAEGSVQETGVEETFTANFVGSDPDGGPLTLTAENLPDGATLTPSSGATGASPLNVTLEWTPGPDDFGRSYDVSIAVRDELGGVARRSFRLKARDNQPPTFAGLAPASLECVDGKHRVELSATVHDADGHSMTVRWRVDGEVEASESNVPPGTEVFFGFDYGHGAHNVVLEANDGFATRSVATTVTVADTRAPSFVFVAPDVVVPTDPGKAFASNVVLTPPEVGDASGHGFTLTNDAPSTYDMGQTVVTWTAEDEAGNVGTATQRVVVQDRERPTIVGSAPIKSFCDPGKIFSTAKLPRPSVSDNVDDSSRIAILSDAPLRFPIGKTRVTFTAIDRSGNSATWPVDVTVVNRKPRANAGNDVTVTTASPRGVRLLLNGSKSSDPDKHKLKFAWKATKGVSLSPTNGAKPAGTFPIGTTNVTLTVTDAGGLKHSDVVRVIVKLKSRRPRGTDADRSFAAASQQAGKAVAANGSTGAALSGLAHANAATAYGAAASQFVLQGDGPFDVDAPLTYSELRAMQAACGEAAATALLSAYAETGDESLLSAYGYAAYGTAYAAADLTER